MLGFILLFFIAYGIYLLEVEKKRVPKKRKEKYDRDHAAEKVLDDELSESN